MQYFYILSLTFACCFYSVKTHADVPLVTNLHKCGSGVGDIALSGDRIALKNGDVIALADVKAPEYWPKTDDAPPYKSWPHSGVARNTLTKLIQNKPLTFFCNRKKPNHMGEITAHILADQTWVQQALLENGHVWQYALKAKQTIFKALVRAEHKARTAQKGVWRISGYAPVLASSEDIKPGWFQIVRGTVLSSNSVRDKVYLNFGSDWSTDFTVHVPNKLVPLYQRNALPVNQLANREIEVRGWVEWSGGPKIIVTGHNQIRLLK